MAMTLFVNSTSTLSSQVCASGVLQSAGGLITYLGASRLVRDRIDEKILCPLINKMSTLTSYISSFTRYLPSLPSLPVAYAKEIRSSDEVMHFPSQKVLASCLDQHPLTSKQAIRYLSEKGITEAVAESFADTDKVPMGVDLGVMMTLYDLNKKLDLPALALTTMRINLAEALKDCAIQGKVAEENAAVYDQKNDL